MSDTDFDTEADLGLFGDLDLASANDNPFFKDDGTYVCRITGAVMRLSKKKPEGAVKGNKGFAIDYTIAEGLKKGQRIQEWKNVPWPWQVKGYPSEEDMKNETNQEEKIASDAARDISFLKLRLKELGIPEDAMSSIKSEALLNLGLVDVTIFNKDGQERISGVALNEGSSDADPFS